MLFLYKNTLILNSSINFLNLLISKLKYYKIMKILMTITLYIKYIGMFLLADICVVYINT